MKVGWSEQGKYQEISIEAFFTILGRKKKRKWRRKKFKNNLTKEEKNISRKEGYRMMIKYDKTFFSIRVSFESHHILLTINIQQ